MQSLYFVDGNFVDAKSAVLPLSDFAISRGFAVFDYLRTYDGRPFHLWDHLLRLQYSAAEMGIGLPYTLEEIAAIIKELLQKNNLPEAAIKIMLTGGDGVEFSYELKPRLSVLVFPLFIFPQELYDNGIRLITTRLGRLFPWAKSTHYASAVLAVKEAQKRDAQDALYVNAKGEILEATTSNFFAFKDGVLITPESEEVLLGITRAVVLKTVHDKFPIQVRSIQVDEPLDEAFITSSTREIMPVSSIDGKAIATGPLTKQTIALFREYVTRGSWEPLEIPRYICKRESGR